MPAEAGQILVMAALALVVLLAFLGLVIDVGRLYVERQQLRNWCDAAATAGAQELPADASAAIQVAFQYFCSSSNGGGTPPGSPVSGTAYTIAGTGREVTVTSPYGGDPSAIRVDARRQVDSVFMGVIGIRSTRVSAHTVGLNDLPFLGTPLVAYSTNPGPGGRSYSLAVAGNTNRFITAGGVSAAYTGQKFSLDGNNNGAPSGPADEVSCYGTGPNLITGSGNNVAGVQTTTRRDPGDEPWEDATNLRRFFRHYAAGNGEGPHIPPVASTGDLTINDNGTHDGPRYIIGNLRVRKGPTLRGWWYCTGTFTVDGNGPTLDSTTDTDPRSGFYSGEAMVISAGNATLKGAFHAGDTLTMSGNGTVLTDAVLYSDSSVTPYGATISGQQMSGVGSVGARSGVNLISNGFEMSDAASGAPGKVVLYAGAYDTDNNGGQGRHLLTATGNNAYFREGMTLYNPYGHVLLVTNSSTLSVHADTIELQGNSNVLTPAGGGGNPVPRIAE